MLHSPELLFVYGTLQSTFANRWARLLRRHATLLGTAETKGRLYRMRGYPALRISGSGAVYGQLWQLRDLAVLRELDNYEGRNYQRLRVDVQLKSSIRPAFAYAWRRPLPEWRRIQDGIFSRSKPNFDYHVNEPSSGCVEDSGA